MMTKGIYICEIDSCDVVLYRKRLYFLKYVYTKMGEQVAHPKIRDEIYFEEGDEYHSILLREIQKIICSVREVI